MQRAQFRGAGRERRSNPRDSVGRGEYRTPVRLRVTLVALVALALAASAGSTPLAATGDLATRLAKTLRSPHLSLARTSAIAVDLRTGAVLFEHNATRPVVPASNEKLPVAWAALIRLGPDYRLRTQVLGVGTRTGSTWDGDMYLRGGGDPELASSDIGRLAAAVRTAGITRVTGLIRGDESAYDAKRGVAGWKRSFVGLESPPLSALVVDRALGWPKLSPALLAARALRDALIKRHVAIDGVAGLGTTPAAAVPLATDHSVRLATLAKAMNRDSDNFTAEMILKHLGTLDGHVGTSARGARVVLEELVAARIPTTGVRIVDGSGLSSLDRLTAVSLVGVIRAGLANPRIRAAFTDSLAVAGRSGTLRTRLPALAGAVKGKTGTTSLSCSLSGVAHDSVVFAVLQNGSPVAFWPARVAQDKFVTALARLRTPAGKR
jgi:D-alanyl-D-alanine carboxypeptidase/D-alanyl-D-alanine-endopeptidase (penicillin-binding protein 4)